MDKFKFSLQKVLDFKKNVEKRKKEEFIKAQKNYLIQKNFVSELIEEKNRELNINRKLRNSFEFQSYLRYIEYLDRKIEGEMNNLRKLEKILIEKKSELIRSASDRKTLEKLKEKAKEEFYFEMNRREQKINDDYAMNSFIRHGRG
ncbi:flagellar export protein FliJ [Fonticella tunisiensis]|uniref:Flagellar FliJ protein n=1 Tax=Fonticella tunisiensis TaxID=1096341 RepID=A0A4R7KA01_9CLOT|nr:flagellar export protein FliJ [Fonticella tunisiensis]TDT50608.1 flagellar FliJ protein [Fonticella tunisiensis]